MATQLNPERKEVVLSQVIEDLASGLTKWKKDDIGFGSLEKKYNLTNQEAIELFSHPKIKNIESRIPTFVIVDDLPEEEIEATIEVAQEVVNTPESTTRVVVAPAPSPTTRVQHVAPKKAEAFI